MRVLTEDEAMRINVQFIYKHNFLAIVTQKEKEAWEKAMWKTEQKAIEKVIKRSKKG